jgi:hypothetical protein
VARLLVVVNNKNFSNVYAIVDSFVFKMKKKIKKLNIFKISNEKQFTKE